MERDMNSSEESKSTSIERSILIEDIFVINAQGMARWVKAHVLPDFNVVFVDENGKEISCMKLW